MSIKESILNNLAIPVLLAVLLPIAGALGSFLSTGEWIAWIQLIPWYGWIIFLLLILVWIIAIFIYRRFKKIKDTGPTIFGIPYVYKRHVVGELPYAGVIWKIYVDFTEPFDSLETTAIKNFDAEATPRCPDNNCKTELEEQKSFWGGYIWSCPRCGFKKKNKDSRYTESERAAKIARSDIEKKRNKQQEK